MSKNSNLISSGNWRNLPPEALLILRDHLRARRSTKFSLPALHSAQQQIIEEARRFNAVACGRRFGKTLLGIELTSIAKEGWPVAWFSPTYKMLAETWREAKTMLQFAITNVN